MLRIERLSVSYGLARAVSEISLNVGEGEIVGLLGRNGAGKSTTLRAVSGLERVEDGAVSLGGRDITNRPPDVVARAGLGHVLEDRGVFGDLTVAENLRASFTGVSRRDERSRLAEIHALFPWLEERQGQLAASLSGGQQQMVAIARALLRRPKVLLLDEPSKGLAPAVVGAVGAALRQAVTATGMGALLVEQSFDLLWRLSDRVCVLEQGRIVLEGAKEALTVEAIQAAYFGEADPAAPGGGR